MNGVAQKKTIPGTDTQFSAEGFAGGEQYEVSLVAYPKTNLTDAEPIASNTQVAKPFLSIGKPYYFYPIGI